MKLKIKTWHVIVLLFMALVTWIQWDNDKEEQDNNKYDNLMTELSRPMPWDKASVLWMEAYNVARDNNKKRWCKGHLIMGYENKGDLSQALELLSEYEEEFEQSTPTAIHRAILLVKCGEEQKGKQMLDSISISSINYDAPSSWDNCVDLLFNGSKGENANEAYLNYFNEYVCRLVALSYRAGMETGSLTRVQCLEQYENVADVDSLIKEYQKFICEHPEASWYFYNQQMCIQQYTHLYLFYNYWNPDNTVDDIMRFKWTFIQTYLDAYDNCYGYDKTKEKFQRIVSRKKVASEGYQKWLINAYLECDSQNSKYYLRYDEYKKLNRNGYGWLVKLSPNTSIGKPSAFVNAGVTKPCILLSCNDWSICDSTLFNREMILKDKGKVKKVVILKDDFSTDTLKIKEDMLGVLISYRPVNSMTLDLVRNVCRFGKRNKYRTYHE